MKLRPIKPTAKDMRLTFEQYNYVMLSRHKCYCPECGEYLGTEKKTTYQNIFRIRSRKITSQTPQMPKVQNEIKRQCHQTLQITTKTDMPAYSDTKRHSHIPTIHDLSSNTCRKPCRLPDMGRSKPRMDYKENIQSYRAKVNNVSKLVR